jgi:hypothetical protein
MSSKTLNKRKKSRGLKNRTKKHMRKYLGGGKYDESNRYLHKAYSELGGLRGPDAALGHLKQLQALHPTDDELEELIDELKWTVDSLKRSQSMLVDLMRLNDDDEDSS